jgi:hypothetical protein
MNQATKLSDRLAAVVEGGFFRPIARPSAPIYIDCADRLAQSADEGGQLTHNDTLVLIREVLALHPRAQLSDDEGGHLSDLRQRAGQIFNKLLEAGWLQERTVSLDERWVLLTPRVRPLIRLLREFAEDSVAELKDFAATLRSICQTLLADGALDPACLTPEEFRQTIRELNDRVERAGEQMHSVESLILKHEDRQRASINASETLNRLLVEFHAGEHMVCYDALQEGGLIPRLRQARSVVQDALANPFAKQRLADGLTAHHGIDPTDAYIEAEKVLRKLENGIAAIPIKQRLIDGRMADFSKLSTQRYRYQTEIRGRRPEQVKTYLNAADSIHAGQSFADLRREPGMTLLCPDVTFFFGQDSLAPVRRLRPQVDLTLTEPPSAGDVAQAQDLLRNLNLNLITPQRAVRFVEKHLPKKGTKVSSSELSLHTEDDFFDLLAILAFERANGSTPHHQLRWEVKPARMDDGVYPANIPVDRLAGRRVERFILERIA